MTHKTYQDVISLCCANVTNEMDCRLDSHITSWNGMILGGDPNDQCYAYIIQEGINILLNEFDPYNLYEQCYTLKTGNGTAPVGDTWTGNNYDSSDPFAGYYCYMNDALAFYMNQDSVRRALHIPTTASTWQADGNIIAIYNQTYPTAEPSFDYIINSKYYNTSNFAILLYTGDADTMCNWMGAEWFTTQYFGQSLNLKLQQRQPWFYRSDPRYINTLAGYYRSYVEKNIDVLTVRGSGHFVPLDRPAQALQMIYNWIQQNDYSDPYALQQPSSTTISGTETTTTTTRSPSASSSTKPSVGNATSAVTFATTRSPQHTISPITINSVSPTVMNPTSAPASVVWSAGTSTPGNQLVTASTKYSPSASTPKTGGVAAHFTGGLLIAVVVSNILL